MTDEIIESSEWMYALPDSPLEINVDHFTQVRVVARETSIGCPEVRAEIVRKRKDVECSCCGPDWLPTSAAINDLPTRLREYIHDLETNCDPAGMVAENTLVKDLCRQLDAKIAQLKKALYP